MSITKSNSFFKSTILSVALCLLVFTNASSQTSQCIFNVKNDRAYFHDRTALNGKVSFTQREAFLILGDQVSINCQDKNENWIYISYKNSKGTITRGYIKKTDLENAVAKNPSEIENNKKFNPKIKWTGNYAIDTKYSNKNIEISIPNNKGEFEFEIIVASESCYGYSYSGRAKFISNTVATGDVLLHNGTQLELEEDIEESKITFNYIVSKNMIDVKFDVGFRCSPDGIYKKVMKGMK